MTTDNVCFYLQNRLIKTSQTGGQWYSDTSSLVFPGKMFTIQATEQCIKDRISRLVSNKSIKDCLVIPSLNFHRVVSDIILFAAVINSVL